MKKITLFIGLTLVFFRITAQNFVQTTVWKGEARSGGTFIGIAMDEIDAENVIEEINFEKQGTKYEIMSHDIAQIKVNIFDASSTVAEDFKSQHLELEYKYITEIEMISLEYIEDDNIEMAIKFYQNASSVKSTSIIKVHLTELHKNYSKYLFNQQESTILYGYSE